MKEENINYLINSLKSIGLTPENKHIEILDLLFENIVKWNENVNLTRIIDERDFIDKHLLDSLSCMKVINTKDNIKVIDIGTGAGFPLMPLWIFFPNWKVTFVDSVKKKLDFITYFSNLLITNYGFNKDNIKIIHSRAEDLAKDKNYRERYDYVLSRAVSKLASLVELNMPFIKLSGYFVAMKGFDIEEELEEAKKIINITGGILTKESVFKFNLFETDLKRSLVLIKKKSAISNDFPRKAGMAQKSPIL